jgi:hypothetical protein
MSNLEMCHGSACRLLIDKSTEMYKSGIERKMQDNQPNVQHSVDYLASFFQFHF